MDDTKVSRDHAKQAMEEEEESLRRRPALLALTRAARRPSHAV